MHVLPFQDHLGEWGNMSTLDELRSSLVNMDLQIRELERTVPARSGTSGNSTVIVAPGRQVRVFFSGTQQHAEAQAQHSQDNITAAASS